MYEPSRHIATYYIAGFQYWEGALALGKLKPGTQLSLVPEPENPHDPKAVAIYHKKTKLGYVPADENGTISPLCFYGHAGAFELRVLQADKEAAPWHQVRVGLLVRDAR